LTRILYNLFSDRYRERRRWINPDHHSPEQGSGADYWDQLAVRVPGPEESYLSDEMAAKISEAVKALPEEFRLPVILVDMGDLSYAEAAELISCPIGTIRSRLSRARQLLHKELMKYAG
jgi:RNA polymerase sigma-70 factor (ECF subfamily)